MKKIITIVLCFLFFCFKVYALENDTHVEEIFIDNIYSHVLEDGHSFGGKVAIIKANGKVSYCLTPGVPIKSDTYSSNTNFSNYSITTEQLNYIELLSLLGYGYNGRTDELYYIATQELIWEYLDDRNVYYTYGSNGEIINIEDYKNEILNDVYLYNESLSIPLTYETFLDDNYFLYNEQLKFYETDSSYANVNGDELSLYSNEGGIHDIYLEKKRLSNSESYIYYSRASQLIASFGQSNFVSETYSVSLNVNYLSKITIQLKNSLTFNTVNQVIVFKIYDINNNTYININGTNTFYTNNNGYYEFDYNFEYGEYYVEILDTISGYNKIENYYFTVNNENKNDININIFVSPIRYNLVINKFIEQFVGFEIQDNFIIGKYEFTYSNDAIYSLYAAEDIYNDTGLIYRKDSYLIDIHVQRGIGSAAQIDKGKYYLIDQYGNKYDLNFESDIILDLSDYLLKGDILVNKISDGTNLGGAKFEIKTDIYSIQFETNSDGKYLIHNIPYSEYNIQEINAPVGYILDNEIYIIDLNTEKINFILNNVKETEIEEENNELEEPSNTEEENNELEEPGNNEEKNSEPEEPSNTEEENSESEESKNTEEEIAQEVSNDTENKENNESQVKHEQEEESEETTSTKEEDNIVDDEFYSVINNPNTGIKINSIYTLFTVLMLIILKRLK